jgi:hypothetical protein
MAATTVDAVRVVRDETGSTVLTPRRPSRRVRVETTLL